MKKEESILLIGGGADGTRRPYSGRTISVPCYTELGISSIQSYANSTADSQMSMPREIYYAEELFFQDYGSIRFYRHSTLDPMQTIIALINGYKRK